MTLRLGDFEGVWRLDRQIDDRLAGRQGRLAGTAIFGADGQGLTYTEEGLLEFPGQPPLTARQSYLWREAQGLVEVFFSDGRGFHAIDLTKASPVAQHDCAPDIYRVSYDFASWPHWAATWDVTGPRKDYSMVSRYVR